MGRLSLDDHPALLGFVVAALGLLAFECTCYGLAALGVFG